LKRKIALVILFTIFGFLIRNVLNIEPAFSAKKFYIKFATVAPEGSAWLKEMRALDKRLRKMTQGQLGFRLYAGGIAGDELDVLRKIRIGQLHSAAFSGVGIAQILPMVRVLDLPFLFRNEDEVDLVHRELRGYFAEHFREKGFELLSWAEIGDVFIFSKGPIGSLQDLTGCKIWTWSGDPISKETFSLMGTNPIPLSITDVTTALNTGMIDTFYAPPLGALALQWHTYVKYMTSLPLAHATGAVLLSKRYYDKLPPNLQALLRGEVEKTMTSLTHVLRKQSSESIDLIRKSGLERTPLPKGAELEAFYAIHKKVAKRLEGDLYPPKLLQRIYTILNRNP
jgi:TRAP-type C4-dicarboxylate transport system substrate-binding protein